MSQRRPIIAICFILAILSAGCAKHSDDTPTTHSSLTFGMDGSHYLPPLGKPTSSTSLELATKDIPSSAPLALLTSDTENFVIAQGRIITIGSQKSSRILTRSTDSSSIFELLCDSSAIYALHLDGTIERFALDGKISWHTTLKAMPQVGSVLTNGQLIVMSDSQVLAFASKDGVQQWVYHTGLLPVSLCVDPVTNVLYVALTGNSSDATDSIVCFTSEGKLTSSIGFANTRITSNLSLCAGSIAFGAISVSADRSDSRTMHLSLWNNLLKSPIRVWDHQLPYIVTSVANDGESILCAGFRETAGDMTSGIDAYGVSDTSSRWHRRFSYPAVSPLCMSRGFAYMPFTFSTNAVVASKSILITLDLSDGKTVGEYAVPGATTGFVPGVASPIGGHLAYADRVVARMYFLKP